MQGQLSSLWVPKEGSTSEEYEDAWSLLPAPGRHGVFTCRRLQAAVTDGATESMLAGRWARSLAHSFGRAELGSCRVPDVRRVLERVVDDWGPYVDEYIREREACGRPIKWYEEPGLARGAHATLLWARFAGVGEASTTGRWTAIAVGDTCLFQIRQNALIAAWPVTGSADFGTTPALVQSTPASLGHSVASVQRRSRSHWRSGDSFYLATDALAAWFLELWEGGHRPWRLLRDLCQDSFQEWIAHQRAAGAIRDDDTTLVSIQIW